VARLAIAKGFLGEYAKLDKDVRSTAEPAGQNPQLQFAAWRTFLHPSQREIAYHPGYAGPAQVTGGPGTGKTVTVLHRAAFLAARAARAEQVLVTTFAGNMAEALAAQLDLLVLDADVRRKIEVLNVDRLAYHIVKQARGGAMQPAPRRTRLPGRGSRGARHGGRAGLVRPESGRPAPR
jgi:hypothetical protein